MGCKADILGYHIQEKVGKHGTREQRSLSDGSKLIEQTLTGSRSKWDAKLTSSVTISCFNKSLKVVWFVFHIVNFPFISRNIPSAPAYGVYASQLIRYVRCCSNYSDFYFVTWPL